MKKFIALLFIFTVVLAGCTSTGGAEADPCSGGTPSVTLVTDTGGINDKSFNQGTWEGVQQYCTDTGNKATYIETKDQAQLESNLEVAAGQSPIVVASGNTFEKAMYEAAVANPDTKFILIDGQPYNAAADKQEDLPNVHSYLFNEVEAGYLVGYIAGKATTTDHIGFVGGQEILPVQRFGYGFIQGAQAANPDIIIDYNYTGTFDDASIGKTTAQAMYGQGADIIFTAAGGTNAGVIQAAVDSTQAGTPVWVIGVDRDMYDDGIYKDSSGADQSVILTSAMKNVGNAAYAGIMSVEDNTFTSGTTTLDYASGGVGLPEENPNLASFSGLTEEAEKSLEDNAASLATTKEETEKALLPTVTINGSI